MAASGEAGTAADGAAPFFRKSSPISGPPARASVLLPRLVHLLGPLSLGTDVSFPVQS